MRNYVVTRALMITIYLLLESKCEYADIFNYQNINSLQEVFHDSG